MTIRKTFAAAVIASALLFSLAACSTSTPVNTPTPIPTPTVHIPQGTLAAPAAWTTIAPAPAGKFVIVHLPAAGTAQPIFLVQNSATEQQINSWVAAMKKAGYKELGSPYKTPTSYNVQLTNQKYIAVGQLQIMAKTPIGATATYTLHALAAKK